MTDSIDGNVSNVPLTNLGPSPAGAEELPVIAGRAATYLSDGLGKIVTIRDFMLRLLRFYRQTRASS
jgi:hypothetical protein